MGHAQRAAVIKQIEASRGTRVICYLTSDRQNANAQVSKDVMPFFFDHLRAIGRVPRIDLFLLTNGGDTLGAFGLCRLLREFCDHVSVLAPLQCHSAGTLIALGAKDIFMTRGATLSPIDPSITTPLNPIVEVAPGQRQLVPLSVETVASYRDLVTKDWDIKGEEALTAAFRMLAEKVHPMALGDVYRARAQIEHLARKLLTSHRADEDNIARIIATLTRGLGSHDYLISRTEARELLGSQVAADDANVENLVWDLYRDFSEEMELRTAYDPAVLLRGARAAGSAGPVHVTNKLAVIETADAGDVAEQEFVLSEATPQLVPGLPPQLAAMIPTNPAATRQEVVRAGWRHYTI